ncbi:N-acetyltransferase [Halobacteriales archaeon SW_5_68_122]|nr:MAG: N-acetyltransferase [Halobacteriales archaeon SW_5_68_122]
MSVTVRAATGEDLAAVESVARDAWYAAYGGFLEPRTVEAGLAEAYDGAVLSAAVEHDDIEFLVAEADDEVVGFASAERTWADEVELHTLYVHPDRWGEGVGSALLSATEEWAREQSVARIVCGVFAENAVGIEFFEAKGFRRGREREAELAGERHPEYEFEREV